jgi:hypothetical protein
MVADRPVRQEELRRDLAIGLALRGELDDLVFLLEGLLIQGRAGPDLYRSLDRGRPHAPRA